MDKLTIKVDMIKTYREPNCNHSGNGPCEGPFGLFTIGDQRRRIVRCTRHLKITLDRKLDAMRHRQQCGQQCSCGDRD